MSVCDTCTNKTICGKTEVAQCKHYDVSFTRSEVFAMLKRADSKTRSLILSAVEKVYKIKLAY